ncbi:MAG: DNA polymerase Y family protein [Gammaproteobacteria bacterium]|nr:DNA polymerase Y family protein [Gammaproteobacteria bacterium]
MSTHHSKSARRKCWLGIFTPQLQLDQLCITQSEMHEIEVVIVRRQKPSAVISANKTALQVGIELGQTLDRAKAIAPSARFIEQRPEIEQEFQHSIAIQLQSMSSEVICYDSETLLVEIGASESLFGGFDPLLDKLRELLSSLGLCFRLGLGPHPHASTLIARYANTAWQMDAKEYKQWLEQRLVTEVLPLSLADSLEAMGVHQVGQWFALDQRSLSRRFDKRLLEFKQLYLGETQTLPTALGFEETFSSKISLQQSVDNTQSLRFVLARLINDLCAFLRLRQQACISCELALHHEGRRNCHPITRIQLSLSEATQNAAQLQSLWQQRLETVTLESPVDGVSLDAGQLQAYEAKTQDLLLNRNQQRTEKNGLIDLIRNRLGTESVCTLCLYDDHRPEQQLETSAKPPAYVMPLGLQRPVGFYPNAKPICAPQGSHHTEYLESGWWLNDQRRIYTIDQDSNGTKRWIYCEKGQWFCQGVFD